MAAIESVLFVAGRPLERVELRKLLAIDETRLDVGLTSLHQLPNMQEEHLSWLAHFAQPVQSSDSLQGESKKV